MHSNDTWSRRIRTASTTAAVLEIVGGFVSSLPASELERLPREVRAELGRNPRDIHGLALEMFHEDLRRPSTDAKAALLHQVALTFAEASRRVVQIAAEREMGSAPPR